MGLLGTDWEDPRSMATLQLAAGLLGGGNFGQAAGRGLAGYQASLSADEERKRKRIEQQMAQEKSAMEIASMRQAQAQQEQIQGAARQSYRSPEMATGMSMGPGIDGQPIPQVKPGFDSTGFIDKMMQIDPLKGLAFQKSLVPDSLINKLDVKDFTPASVQKFAQTNNFGDLQRMDKLHFADTGGALAGLDPFTGLPVSQTPKTGNPFSDLVLKDGNGNVIPNTPLVGVKAGLARAGASNINNQVSIAGPENKYNQDVGAGLAKEGLTLVDLAKQAPEVVRNAQMIRSALDNGAITGTGANPRLAIEKAMATAGLVGEGRAASTQELMSGLGKITLAGVKTSGLGAGNGFTDKDREFLQGAISGTIDSTPSNLRRVADLSERIATANHQKGAAVLSRWQQDPALRAVSQDSVLDPLPTMKSAATRTNPLPPKPSASSLVKGREYDLPNGKIGVWNGMVFRTE